MKVMGMNREFRISFLYKIIKTLHPSKANISYKCLLTMYYEQKFEYVIISLNRLYGQHKTPIQ
jgi:hypothetical protein